MMCIYIQYSCFLIGQTKEIKDKTQENQDYKHSLVSYRSIKRLCTKYQKIKKKSFLSFFLSFSVKKDKKKMYRKRKSTISRQNMFQHVKRTSNTNNNELIIMDNTYLYGYALLLTTFITFFISVYSIIASKYMPYTGNRVFIV